MMPILKFLETVTMNINSKNRTRLYSLCQVLLDAIASYAILCASLYGYHLCGASYHMTICLKLVYVPFVIVAINAFSRVYGKNLFYPGIDISRVEELKRVTLSVIAGYISLFAYWGITRTVADYSRFALLISFLLTLFILPTLHILFKYLCGKYKFLTRNVLVAGADKEGRKFAQGLEENKYLNVTVVGYLDDHAAGDDILGKVADYKEIAQKYDVPYLVVCLPVAEQENFMQEFIRVFRHILLVPREGLYTRYEAYPMSINHRCSFEISNNLRMKLFRMEKQILEFCISCLVLPMIFPVCLVIALLIKLSSAGPIFYKAKRLGINGKPIEVLKFRTMRPDADAKLEQLLAENPDLKKQWESNFKLDNDPRITGIGNFLRKTSLDELPQFINVIKGEMALIGPRPIVEKEVEYYGKEYEVFSSVKPGITGLWQVSGRSSIDYQDRVALDVFYVNNWSIWLDFYIFIATFHAVLFGRGAK